MNVFCPHFDRLFGRRQFGWYPAEKGSYGQAQLDVAGELSLAFRCADAKT
jgi:hypothetical protein